MLRIATPSVSKEPPQSPAGQVTLEDCILTLLRGIQNHSVIADESDGREFQAELANLESRFKGQDNTRQLVGSAVEILEQYGKQANQIIVRKNSELAGAASELANAMTALPGIQGAAERLNLLEEQINGISTEDDLETIKARLRADVAGVRAEALLERQRIGLLFSGVVTRLGLSPVDSPGQTPLTSGPVYLPDPLTGLPSRAYAEAELTRAHVQSPDSHLALFVVKRLALINAKFGYSRGDQVLLKVVMHLAQSLPEFKKLFRWAPCAFLTVAPPDTSYKELRGIIQLIELMRLTPTLEWEGRSAMVTVAIDCRIISVKDFDTPSDLFLRLDTLASDV